MRRWALIPTHNRPEELRELLASLDGQVDQVLILDNASDPPFVFDDPTRPWITVHYDPEQPPNLSRLWNVGLRWIEHVEDEQAAAGIPRSESMVAILTDDTLIPDGWFSAVQEAMERTGAAAGCSNPFPQVQHEIVQIQVGGGVTERMYGPAFIVRGSTKLRADEELRWWWGDTDMDFKARLAGGMVMIPGYLVVNRHANESTAGILAEQAGRDGETFARKWGGRPW